MRFSVVIPSYLGHYENAASNREDKLVRAVDSVLNGHFKDFEVMVIADGCEKSFDIIQRAYPDNENVDCVLIRKQTLWSGKPRNEGIKRSKGEYIVYLDADDKWGENHLNIIDSELTAANNPDWVFFNDILLDKTDRKIERNVLINQRYQNGTSNICHKSKLAIEWHGNGQYGQDDWSIIQQLHRYSNRVKIKTPQYYVCHFPAQRIDV